MASRIDALAQRLQDDPFFLASALADYARSERLDDGALAVVLGCSVKTLGPLRLCRRPHPEPRLFRQDVERIASRFGVKADVLAAAVRRSDALSRMRRGENSGSGLLVAARDRQPDNHNGEETQGGLL